MSTDQFNPNSVDAKLGSIEAKLDLLMKDMAEHNRRIREIEIKVWGAVGVALAAPWAVKFLL